MRASVRPQAQGSVVTEPMSPVRYRISGWASLRRVVKTSSPSSPSGSGSPVSGSTTSTRKWSSWTCSPSRASRHSAATPGPHISESP